MVDLSMDCSVYYYMQYTLGTANSPSTCRAFILISMSMLLRQYFTSVGRTLSCSTSFSSAIASDLYKLVKLQQNDSGIVINLLQFVNIWQVNRIYVCTLHIVDYIINFITVQSVRNRAPHPHVRIPKNTERTPNVQ